MERHSMRIGVLSAWVMVFAVFALPASGIDLTEIDTRFHSNLAKISSGSCTYTIIDIRPKDNLLAARGDDGGRTVPLPLVSARSEVRLVGQGWFKWQGDRFKSVVVRGHLSVDPVNAGKALFGTVRRIEASNGSHAENLISSYGSSIDPSQGGEILAQADEALLQGHRGTIGIRHPRVGGCPLFRPLGYFCGSLLDSDRYVLDHFMNEWEEEGSRVRLHRQGMRVDVVFDTGKSCMPVEVIAGQEGEDGFIQRTTYIQVNNGVWFPETEVTEKWHDGKLLYTTICSLESYELNRTYPDSDFTISYPEGTELENRLAKLGNPPGR